MDHGRPEPQPATVVQMVYYHRGEKLAEEHQRRQSAEDADVKFVGPDGPCEFNRGRGGRQLSISGGEAAGDNHRALRRGQGPHGAGLFKNVGAGGE